MPNNTVPIIMTVAGVAVAGVGAVGMTKENFMLKKAVGTDPKTAILEAKRAKDILAITATVGGVLTVVTAIYAMKK